jgi:hypothetical protein
VRADGGPRCAVCDGWGRVDEKPEGGVGMRVTVDCRAAFDAGDLRRPGDIIIALGIKWKRYEGIPHIDQVVFYDCTDIPENLPPYVIAREPRSDQGGPFVDRDGNFVDKQKG